MYKKKLIEVAIPLEAINAASAREKSIRHGHPSTLHLWWARRPLAACRAVLFAQLVDDPSGYADKLLDDPKIRQRAEADLAVRLKAWRERKADAHGNVPDTPEPTLEDCAADTERKRLFEIIEELVKWENSTNEEVLERARAEIRRSCGGLLPPVYDPFSGGGSIPLEAQRLGLPAFGSDLNPVAVMIGKAMIEIPPKFKDTPPIHPGVKERSFYRNAEGLAEDVKYYGEWMRDKARERVGHLYPEVELAKERGGGNATVIAWIWARTVASPDPAFGGAHVPLVNSFVLSSKKGSEAIVVPVVDKAQREIRFLVKTSGITKQELLDANSGTKAGKAQDFICAFSGTPIQREYIRDEGKSGRLGAKLMAIVAEGSRSRVYSAPNQDHEVAADISREHIKVSEARETFLSGLTPTRAEITGGVCSAYGLTTWGSLYTDRQLVALLTFSDQIPELRAEIEADALSAGLSNDETHLRDGGCGAKAYAEAVSIYLGFAISRLADRGSSVCGWDSGYTKIRNTFARQGIPMAWDFAEGNPFSSSTGNWISCCEWIWKVVAALVPGSSGIVEQQNAQLANCPLPVVISTDPPYYDNIAYSTLSDFFYAWIRRALRDIEPALFGVIATPKSDELVAIASRHGGREGAEKFFIEGMTAAVSRMAILSLEGFPATIYYAFKQSEIADEGVSSTGWATFLHAVIEAGFAVVGTWPLRTEMANRMIASGTNALANSVVLVCRKKEATAEVITRAEFVRSMKRELPSAIAELQAANIAPADMPQSAIGPGMGVFSRYTAVLESDDSPMSVKTALQLINRELDEYLGGIQGEFDADTRFAITWFEQHGMEKGGYGAADNLARARGISVESVKHAGIIESAVGKVRILARGELDDDWEPEADGRLTVWECLQHLVRQYEKDGISHETAVLLKKIDAKAEAVKDLAYCLYDISANKRKDAKEATAYNALIADWTELTRQAAAIHDTSGDRQIPLNI
jgi:putative DNA methylase